jgi:hypothetical protein
VVKFGGEDWQGMKFFGVWFFYVKTVIEIESEEIVDMLIFSS